MPAPVASRNSLMRAGVTAAMEREVERREMAWLRESGAKALAMVAVRARAAATFILLAFIGLDSGGKE